MATETIHCDRDILRDSSIVHVVGGTDVFEVLDDDDLETYVRGTAVTGSAHLRLGLPTPSIAGPITRIDCTATFRGQNNSGGFALGVYPAHQEAGQLEYNSPPGDAFTILTQTKTLSSLSLPVSWFSTAEVFISLFGTINGIDEEVRVYELSFTVHNEPAIGYDAPPPEIPVFMFRPPQPRFVYPY